jgi:3-dehydroquinate synthase
MNERELTLTVGERTIPIVFADERVEWVAQKFRSVLSEKTRIMVVSDERVTLLYEKPLTDALLALGYDVSCFTLPMGEAEKRFSRVAALLDELAARRFNRDDVLLALGGGVVTDMAGFAAAIYKRGMNWIAVPTTLLGMVDAAIGGKTGVDHPLGKNMIGAFHQPLAVFVPLNVLNTLDAREWLSGSAEVVKSALLGGEDLWRKICEWGLDLHAWQSSEIASVVSAAAKIKIEVVAVDEREAGVRRILNFGHTFGHVLEAVTGYAIFTHGEAVFLGMRAAIRISAAMSLLKNETAREIESVLARAPFPAVNVDASVLTVATGDDKKNTTGGLNWVLLEQVGKPAIRADVPQRIVHETAEWLAEVVSRGYAATPRTRKQRIIVLNGPNLNLLGTREPIIYGHDDYRKLMDFVQAEAELAGADVLMYQSNCEGDMISYIQRARHWADGIIINPGGYTHTSVAIHDALAAVAIPAVEVHLSDIGRREEFRKMSLLAPVCIASVQGEGMAGYEKALRILLDHLKK